MAMYRPGDIVVFLPGISGSVLERDGRVVWGASGSAMLRAITSRAGSIRDLALTAVDDPTLDDLGDGVRATALMPDIQIIPGLVRIDGYGKLVRNIGAALGLKEGVTLFPFPYDWRRDNRVSARLLGRAVAGWVQARRAQVPDAKAVLIGHSMGGIVSRYFLEVLGGWDLTRSLITFGTPYGGSPQALDYLANGYRMGPGLLAMDLTDLLASFTSTYQLLPTYECVEQDGTQRLIQQVPTLPVDATRAAAALAFHDEIAAAVRNRPAGLQPLIAPIVGIEQDTIIGARIDGNQVVALHSEAGDGTVPRVSAIPFELQNTRVEVFAAQRHGSLQNDDAVLGHVRGLLSEPESQPQRVRAGPEGALTLLLADAFPTGAVIEFSVRYKGDRRPDVQAQLTDAAGQVIATGPLKPKGSGLLVGRLPTQAEGAYRVTLTDASPQAPTVATVTEVFLVIGDAP